MPDAAAESTVCLSTRLETVRDALAGFPGTPTTQRKIAQSIGVDPSNFNNMLRGRRPVSATILARLHQVFRLESLGVGFDTAFWTEGKDDAIAARILCARGGDVVDVIAHRLASTPFVAFVPEGPSALIFGDAGPNVQPWPAIPQQPARVGAALALEVRAPVDGLLKVVCVEGGEAIGLDAYFGLTHQMLRRGATRRFSRSFPVRAHPPEALFVALMRSEPFGPEWPTRDEADGRLSSAAFADLLRIELTARPAMQVAAIRLFAV